MMMSMCLTCDFGLLLLTLALVSLSLLVLTFDIFFFFFNLNFSFFYSVYNKINLKLVFISILVLLHLGTAREQDSPSHGIWPNASPTRTTSKTFATTHSRTYPSAYSPNDVDINTRPTASSFDSIGREKSRRRDRRRGGRLRKLIFYLRLP